MAAIHLHINGKKHRLDVAPDIPLLYVLRNQLLLNGPKYGCGLEQCGACMVLIDQQAMPSCVRPCGGLGDSKIVTLDALASKHKLHALQSAFVEEQAAQCGYCTNGMIITAKALLDRIPHPNDAEIKEAMQRVLCRCGTQSRILKAIKRVAFQP